MKPLTENEKQLFKHNNQENREKDRINRERIEQMASAYNHQERVAHVNKTVAQFNAMFTKLNASKNGEN